MKDKPSYEELEQKVEKLQVLESLYRSIVEGQTEFIVRFGPDGVRTFVNESYCKYFGKNKEELIGTSFFPLIDSADFEKVKKRLEKLSPENPVSTDEHRVMLPDGNVGWNQWTDRAIFDETGKLIEYQSVGKDTTECHNTEKRLKEAYNIINKSQAITFLWKNMEGWPVEFVSDNVIELFGYSAADFVSGRVPYIDVIHPEDMERIAGEVADFSIGKEHERFSHEPYRIVTKDGTVKWLDDQTFIRRDEKGRITHYQGIVLDITKRKHAETALEESEKQFRSFIHNFQGIAYRGTMDFVPVFFHGTVEEITGYSEKDFVSGVPSWDKIIFPDDLPEALEDGKKMRSIPNYSYQREYRIVRKDGQIRWVFEKAQNVCDKSGTSLFVEGAIYDITKRKQVEEELKENEGKLRDLIETVNDWIWTVDSQGTYIYVSPRVKDMLGYTPEEMLGKTPFDFMQAEEVEKIKIFFNEKVSRKEAFDRLENVNVHKDGRHVVLETSATPVLDNNGTLVGYRGVDRDITERKNLEEERLKVQKLESTGILAGGIAHDFNNILTAILGNISMAKIFAESNEKVLERLLEAEKASMRAQDLSQQLLTFSKGGEPIKKPTEITALIKETSSFSLTGSNVKCNLFMADKLWPANIDEGQISQVIQNVVQNADQAMPDGGTIIIEAENIIINDLNTFSLKEGKYVLITIKDQGGGIPEKHIARIFDPYFSTKHDGSGLGLASSFSIVKKHDGHISAESVPGEGATFHIYLSASEKMGPAKKRAKEKSLQSGGKILIMDDDQAILEIATQMLNMMGFKTETAINGQEAVALYRKAQKDGHSFNAVLLDLTIPGGMGGKETMKQLADIDPEVKAIVSSGYANDPIMADYKSFGFSSVVPKPYNIEKLGEALRILFG